MNVRAGVTSLVFTCTLVTIAAAQEKPVFAGRWTSEPAAPPQQQPAGTARPQTGARPPARDMGSGWGPTITIAQDATALTVEYAFFARGDMQPPLRFTYALNGSETRNSVMMGRGIQEQ